jgi:hypothetical protein
MTLAQRKQLLLDEKLELSDFYVVKENFGEKIIIRRTGIDKLEHRYRMAFTIEAIQTVPYGNKCCTTVYASGRIDTDTAKTVASANPDNCQYPHYAETAEKRARHKLLLKLLRLHEHDIFSQEESDAWSEDKNKHEDAVAKTEKALNKSHAAQNGQK